MAVDSTRRHFIKISAMPTIGKSVQFRGINNAVTAYKNMAIPTWGLFQGSQFLMKYVGKNLNEGAELLEQYLESLDQRSADGNTYTLCIYDTDEKINSGTKYDASFNFRLIDNIENHLQGKLTGVLESRISGIEEKLDAVLNPQDQDEPTVKDQLLAAFSKILEVPQVQHAIANKLLGVIDGVGNTLTGLFTAPGLPRAAIGATKREPVNPNEENEKLQQAVNILVEVDPQLGTNLLKLATIAKADPAKYNLLVSMLKNM